MRRNVFKQTHLAGYSFYNSCIYMYVYLYKKGGWKSDPNDVMSIHLTWSIGNHEVRCLYEIELFLWGNCVSSFELSYILFFFFFMFGRVVSVFACDEWVTIRAIIFDERDGTWCERSIIISSLCMMYENFCKSPIRISLHENYWIAAFGRNIRQFLKMWLSTRAFTQARKINVKWTN